MGTGWCCSALLAVSSAYFGVCLRGQLRHQDPSLVRRSPRVSTFRLRLALRPWGGGIRGGLPKASLNAIA